VRNIRFEVRAFDHADVVSLVEEIQDFYRERYGLEDADHTPPAQFAPPLGLFVLGYCEDEIVASGGWRWLDDGADGAVEIKRMWVRTHVRRQGISRLMLAELERTAAEAGAQKIRLNTGYRQPEALTLYDSSGYERTDERYGHYALFDGAQFFVKLL
jgi:ribosomal protein S18 acetylase RimI-like enzyme